MTLRTLIRTDELVASLNDPNLRIVDCRFSLADTERGRQAWSQSHIPGAVYAHLDEDLSGPIIAGQTGRHPLPSAETFATTLGTWGIDNRTRVVAYDDFGGAIASRLWWMLRWLGHSDVAVLDGGWLRWTEEGHPVEETAKNPEPVTFIPSPDDALYVDAAAVDRLREDKGWCLCDARGAARYRGEQEPIDPVAGHIPGAVNLPFAGNLDEHGRFLSREQLAARFNELKGETPVDRVVMYCGSGVTAAHNLLAMAHAGLEGGKMYPGSWSEWITDPNRPVG